MAIPCAALMCHAPIVIPELGAERAGQCARTSRAMAEVATRLAAHHPDVLVLISPHTPRQRVGFGVVDGELLSGDFEQFGRPDLRVQARGAPAAAAALRASADGRELRTWSARGTQLDHGALVPLHFVVRAGYCGPVLLLALPYPDTGTEVGIGRAIADAAAALGQRWAVLASGDMSHRLCEDAPAGFHPRAQRFDDEFRAAVAAGAFERIAAFDPELRELAAEDVVDSCTIAVAAAGFSADGCRVVEYEGPFGVGYLEAILHEPVTPDVATDPPERLLAIARAAIDAYLRGDAYPPPALPGPWDAPRGAFVTLRTARGELRGCVGHVEPGYATLAAEIASCAIAAASRDSRFLPVQLSELPDLRLELSLLTPPEPVAGLAELDPARYGLIVAAGTRRGVLLPQITGIDSAREQLRIARLKAGISSDDAVELARFEVLKLSEASSASGASGGDERGDERAPD